MDLESTGYGVRSTVYNHDPSYRGSEKSMYVWIVKGKSHTIHMTDFFCRTHNKSFNSLTALGVHIGREHSSEGTIHCVYRDKNVPSPPQPSKSVAEIKVFVGDGLKRMPTRPTTDGRRGAKEEGMLTSLELLYEAPRFIVEAVHGMKHRKMRKLYQDVHKRYSQVLLNIDALPALKRSSRLKQAVFSLLLPA